MDYQWENGLGENSLQLIPNLIFQDSYATDVL